MRKPAHPPQCKFADPIPTVSDNRRHVKTAVYAFQGIFAVSPTDHSFPRGDDTVLHPLGDTRPTGPTGTGCQLCSVAPRLATRA